jgi:transposase
MDIEQQTILIGLVAKGLSDQEVADQMDGIKSRKTVMRWRKKLGIKKSPGRGSWSKKKREQEREKMLQRDRPYYEYYWEMDEDGVSHGRKTYEAVAKEFGISRTMAGKRIRRYKTNLFQLTNNDSRERSDIEKLLGQDEEDPQGVDK